MHRQVALSSHRLPLSSLVIREVEDPKQRARQSALEAKAQKQHAAAMQEAAARPPPQEPQQWLPHLQAIAQRQWEQHAELLAHLELLEVRQQQQHLELMRRREPATVASEVSRENEEALRQLAAELHSQQRVEVLEMQRHLEDRVMTILDQRMPIHKTGRLSSTQSVVDTKSVIADNTIDAKRVSAESAIDSKGLAQEPARRPEEPAKYSESSDMDEPSDVPNLRLTMRGVQSMRSVLNQTRDSKAIAKAYEDIQRHSYRHNKTMGLDSWQAADSNSKWSAPRPQMMFAGAVVVFANMATLGVEMDVCINAARNQAERPMWVFWVNMLFTAYFTVEMAARMVLERDAFYRGQYRNWNFLDALLVITSWIDMIFDTLDLSAFRVLRVHLVLRSFRILRFVGSMKRLRLVVTAFVHSAFTALWACLSLAVVLYTFALLFLQGVETHARAAKDSDDSLYRYYGSIAKTMACLFMAITHGREWEALVQPLNQVSPLYFGLFVFYVGFVLFFIMNLLTAIFVERTSQIAKVDSDLARQEELDQDGEIVARIRECLKGEDGEESRSVVIGRLELEWLLQGKDMLQNLNTMGLDPSQVFALYDLLADQDLGGVDREELLGALTRLKSSAKGVDIATLMFETQRINRQICALMRLMECEFSQLGNGLDKFMMSVNDSVYVVPGRRSSMQSLGPIL